MNALTYTATLLLLLAATTYVALQQGTDTALGAHAMKLRIEARRNVENQYQHAIYKIKNLTRWESGYTGPKRDKPPSSGTGEHKESKPDLADFPALLNIAPILSQKTGPLLETLERLLQINYEDQEFFPPGIEKPLVEALSKAIDLFDGTLSEPEKLACIDLGELQPIWIAILKGKEGHYPSLLDQISFDGKKPAGINVLWAPEALLMAALQEPPLVEHLLIKRAEFIEHYATTEKASDANDFLKGLPSQLKQLITNHPTAPPEILPYLSYKVDELPSTLVLHNEASPYTLKERRRLVVASGGR